jgi:hypothetical protein
LLGASFSSFFDMTLLWQFPAAHTLVSAGLGIIGAFLLHCKSRENNDLLGSTSFAVARRKAQIEGHCALPFPFPQQRSEAENVRGRGGPAIASRSAQARRLFDQGARDLLHTLVDP